jgi:hypothetical protein
MLPFPESRAGIVAHSGEYFDRGIVFGLGRAEAAAVVLNSVEPAHVPRAGSGLERISRW